MLIATGHIVGAIFATLVFSIAVVAIAAWMRQRNQKRRLEEVAVMMGVSAEDLDKEEFAPKLLKISSQRYSSELFRNRLSDLCGILSILWGGTGSLLQVAILLVVIWYTATDSLTNAPYAWIVPAITIVFWFVAVTFALTCRLFTGRHPGEAKQARKAAAEYLKLRSPPASSVRGDSTKTDPDSSQAINAPDP